MNAKKAIREIMYKKGIGTKQMADMLGSNMQKVVDSLSEGKGTNMSIRLINEFLGQLDYKVVFIPNDVELKEEWYEVDSNASTN